MCSNPQWRGGVGVGAGGVEVGMMTGKTQAGKPAVLVSCVWATFFHPTSYPGLCFSEGCFYACAGPLWYGAAVGAACSARGEAGAVAAAVAAQLVTFSEMSEQNETADKVINSTTSA